MITPGQLRAARALLDFTQSELAMMAGVALATIQRIENSNEEISGSARTLLKLHAALVDQGVEFLAGDDSRGPGVRLREPRGRI